MIWKPIPAELRQILDASIARLKNLLGHSSMQTTEVYLRRYDKRAAMQPVRSLSWAGAASGNAEAPESPQIAAKWLDYSSVVGAGGFEPP